MKQKGDLAPTRAGLWTSPDAYVDALVRRRSSRKSRSKEKRTEPEAPRFSLSTLPFVILMAALLVIAVGIILAASIGGAIEIAPLFTIDDTVEEVSGMRVYTPLEQAGRDIYAREGCYACHSQMIRSLRDEVERYGPYSLAVES